uniref:Uncharacterized protein n=1 Tax=Clytia hemisphaerica TaxID=252671 RepID=A0A7M5X1H9_9CNID
MNFKKYEKTRFGHSSPSIGGSNFDTVDLDTCMHQCRSTENCNAIQMRIDNFPLKCELFSRTHYEEGAGHLIANPDYDFYVRWNRCIYPNYCLNTTKYECVPDYRTDSAECRCKGTTNADGFCVV